MFNCIYRDEVKQKIKERIGCLDYVRILNKGDVETLKQIERCKKVLNQICCDIDDIRTADVQPVKRGRWIEQRHTPTNGYNYNVPYSTYVCSSCGLEIHNDEYSKYVRGIYTNCPVCTARMDAESDEPWQSE